ncbi:glycosyltransferase family 76 protein [Flagelloscypha sp. PMI_526]|nr:glycosyltransferase family 76 protein [Flagelloscypha sp. PMI_526]
MSNGTLVKQGILRRVLVYALALFSSHLFPLFDASPHTILHPKESWLDWFAWPLLRWDAFHFLHMAQNDALSTQYEYEWAFFPGPPLTMRIGAAFLRPLVPHPEESEASLLLLGGSLVTAIFEIWSIIVLHKLTKSLFSGSASMASLTVQLAFLPSSPAVLSMAPYSEPIFTFFAYTGMLSIVNDQIFFASLAFTVAGLFRANGVFLAGFIIWHLLIQPLLSHRRLPHFFILSKAAIYTAIPFIPFVYHHAVAFAVFCNTHAAIAPEWCSRRFPLIYPYVQAKYWNSGFLLYWTPQQIPNFIIAAPPLVVLVLYSKHVITNFLSERSKASRPRPHPHLLPQALYTLFVAFILIFASHTQIVPPTWLLVTYALLGSSLAHHRTPVVGESVGGMVGRMGPWIRHWALERIFASCMMMIL